MSRSVPWRTNCPQSVKSIFERLPSCQLLLVKRIGPTSFLLSGREGRDKYKTSIGDPHHCSCGDNTELCVHVVFVLCKVFFLPKENPLVWQRSLVAAEIDELLRSETRVRNAQRRVVGTGMAAPREVEKGDVCPICFEELGDDAPLSYCQGECGKYLHTYCFKQYMRHNSNICLRCPYCRSPWINDPSATSKKCSGCKKYVNGQCYMCLFCHEYFLCGNCFHCSDAHPNHPFSLLGASEVAERHNAQAVSSVQSIRESSVPVSAPAPVPAEVLPLMYRELDPDDYETLLQLDSQNSRRVLTVAQFRSLKREAWSSSLAAETCHICLEPFDTTSTCVWLTCGHFFHLSCAQTWLTEHSAVCPLDQHPVVAPDLVEPVTASSSPLPPVVRPPRRPTQRNQRRENPPTVTAPRRVAHPVRRRAERERVSASVSLPLLGLQVLSLGLAQRPEQNRDRFRYGSA